MDMGRQWCLALRLLASQPKRIINRNEGSVKPLRPALTRMKNDPPAAHTANSPARRSSARWRNAYPRQWRGVATLIKPFVDIKPDTVTGAR